MTNSPGRVPASEVVVTDFSGAPAKRSLKTSLQSTSKPQLAGSRSAMSTPLSSESGIPTAVCAQARPAGAAKRKQRRIAVDSRGPFGVSKTRPGSAKPVQRWR